MLFSIGVVGPPDLVGKTLDVAGGFPQYRFLGLSYEDENDTVPLFERNRARMDVCLFTGNWPYLKVRKYYGGRDCGIPLVYVYDTGLGIYQALAKMLHEGVDTTRLSIDTATPDEAKRCLTDIGLQSEALFFLSVDRPIEKSEFVSFHRSLWKRGKTTAAATFLRSAYAELRGDGMPVYRCTPSLGGLKEAVVRAVLELEALKARASQLVVGLVSFGRRDTHSSREQRPPGESALSDSPTSRASLLKALLEWAGPLGISVVPLEGGRFGLFMTRGVLEEVTEKETTFETASRIAKRCGRPVFFGFGVAPTASLSFANASLALGYSIEAAQSCAFAVFEDSRIVGPLGSGHSPETPNPLEFSTSTIDPALVLMSSQSGLSVPTVSRVKTVLRANGSLFITADQLAMSLSISKRNARRILTNLADAGLARVAGLNQGGTRGRPQRIFKVLLE
jgi:hypothetical protein